MYVKLVDGVLNSDRYTEGVKLGRLHVSDGRSHLINFRVDDVAVGESGSELRMKGPGVVTVKGEASAFFDLEPTAEAKAIHDRPLDQKPFWSVERIRIGNSRRMPVEVVVNGKAAARVEIEADGAFHNLNFQVPLERSSGQALRIYPTSHINPAFVVADDKPICASKQSAARRLEGVDQCWSQKGDQIRASERDEARAAYGVARAAYKIIMA